jgi:FO synthase
MASLEALAGFDHLQEVILQNFVPHRRYYGEEPADIATEAAEAFWRTGVHDGPVHGAPAWASPVGIEDMKRLIAETRRLMPGVGIQVPPNLADWWPELVAAGATDLGGLSANGDHISPEHPFPSPHQVRKRLAEDGVALAERLCVYPRFIDAGWIAPRVLEVIRERYRAFIPRRGTAAITPGTIARARDGHRLDPGELAALFAESRPEVIEDMRQAADELRAELAGDTVTFVVNRNINVSNVCVVGCAFCGFGVGRRSPDAYEHDRDEFVRRVHEAVDYGATEICMQSGIHPDWSIEDYEGWLRLAKETAPQLHLHAYSPMEIDAMSEERPLDEVFARLTDAGLDSVPGTAAEVLHDGVRRRISPNKLPVARWVEIVEAAHRAGLRSTVTVMFGHVETPEDLAEHMRVVRTLQERTGGFTEFVPLSFIPFHTQLGRTHGIEEISREENLKHTAAFRLALGRTIPNLQASWVKMGLDAATEALRWGVNDLGGTLMEESISRMAGSYHGVKLDPDDLIAAAHRAGRPAAERTTLYGIRRRHELAAAA